MKVFRLADLASAVNGRLDGDADLAIRGVNDVATAKDGEITFVTTEKYLKKLASSKASAVVTSSKVKVDRPAIAVDRPELAFAKLLELFAPPRPDPKPGIDPTAVVETDLPASVAVGANCYIGPRTAIGENTIIYPNVTIGPDVTIGRDGLVWPGVVIRERVTIGDRVIIHPNVTIGSDGFGYNLIDGRHRKIVHIGTVVIEDDVEIGAGTCIDRAKAGETRIGTGTKVDNLVQIGHNAKIGNHSILVAHAAIGGSAQMGDYVVLAGKAGVREHIHVGDRVQIAAFSCAMKDVPQEAVVGGTPAIDLHDFLRQQARLRRLPNLVETVTKMAKRIDELEQTIHDLKRSTT